MLAVGNARGNTERVAWIKGSEGLTSQVGKMATVPGWSQTPEVAGGAGSMAASRLQAG